MHTLAAIIVVVALAIQGGSGQPIESAGTEPLLQINHAADITPNYRPTPIYHSFVPFITCAPARVTGLVR